MEFWKRPNSVLAAALATLALNDAAGKPGAHGEYAAPWCNRHAARPGWRTNKHRLEIEVLLEEAVEKGDVRALATHRAAFQKQVKDRAQKYYRADAFLVADKSDLALAMVTELSMALAPAERAQAQKLLRTLIKRRGPPKFPLPRGSNRDPAIVRFLDDVLALAGREKTLRDAIAAIVDGLGDNKTHRPALVATLVQYARTASEIVSGQLHTEPTDSFPIRYLPGASRHLVDQWSNAEYGRDVALGMLSSFRKGEKSRRSELKGLALWIVLSPLEWRIARLPAATAFRVLSASGLPPKKARGSMKADLK